MALIFNRSAARNPQSKQYVAYGNNRNMNTNKGRTDKFGNPTELIACTQVVDKKSGELLPIHKGYVEMNGTLVKVEISQKNSPSKDGRHQMWAKFTVK